MFLQRVYKEWRLLFWVILLLIAAQFFFMAKGIGNVPFFLYHMYSKDHRPVDSLPVYLIRTPYGYLNHKQLSNREEEMLMNPVGYYCNLKKDGDGTAQAVEKRFRSLPSSLYNTLYTRLVNDSSGLNAFPQWWANYLKSVMNNENQLVQVVRSHVYAKPPYNKSSYDSIILYVNLR